MRCRGLFASLLLFSCAVCLPALAAADRLAGRPLAQVLDEAVRSGVKIVYSSRLVPAGLRVLQEPDSTDPLMRLREILAAHSLALKPAAAGIWIVVSKEPEALEDEAAQAAAGQALKSAPPVEITVTGSRYTLLADRPEPRLTLGEGEIQNQPALLDDALRAVRRFPGTAGTEFSSRPHVRGGDANENLVLLDGVPIADPFHFQGLSADLSLIDPASIAQLDFYSGVFPVEYGGRMSSITRLHPRRATRPFGGQASLSFLNASMLLEGTLPREDSDWLVAVRRGTLDLVAKAVERHYGRPLIADGFAQLHIRTGSHTTLTFGVLGAGDDVDLVLPDDSGSTFTDAKQAQAWMAVDREWKTARVLSRLVLADVSQERQGTMSDPPSVSGQLTDTRRIHTATLSQDWQMPVDSSTAMRWGWVYSHADGDYDYRKTALFSPEMITAFGQPPTGDLALAPDTEVQSFAAYAGAEWAPFEKLSIDAGLRWERHLFDTGQRETALDPRVSLLYRTDPRSRWRLAWGWHSQFPTAAELPVDRGAVRYDDAARTSLWVLGWDHEFTADHALRIEIYDKRVRHPWPRLESRIDPLVLVPELEPDQALIAPDRGQVTGIDVYGLAGLGDGWRGWLSYSGSRVRDEIAGQWELRNWDQRHALGAGVTTERWGWTWTGALTVHTGWPTTPLSVSADGTLVLGRRNSIRLPGYGTLDLRTQRTFDLSRGALRVSVELTNASGRKNICCSKLDFDSDATGTTIPRVEYKKLLPPLPFVSVTWEF